MSDAARLLALAAGVSLVGAAAVLLAGVPLARRWAPTVIGLSPAVGLAVCGLGASLGAMVGIDVRLPATAAIAAGCLLVAWVARRGRPAGMGALQAPRPGRGSRAVELVALAGLAVLSVAIVRLYAVTRLDAWDGWAIWAPKAHALFVEGDVWGPVFRSTAYGMQHQEYPILLPSLEALSADAIGRFDPALIDVAPAAVLVAFGWGLWAVLRLVVPPGLAAVAALALTGSAPLIDNGSANYADSVVAAFTALGVVCLLVWLLWGSGGTLALAGLFLAAAASTKAEGLVFALAAIVTALVTVRGFGRRLRSVGAFAAAALAVPIIWAAVDRLNGPGAHNVDRATLFRPDAMADAAGRIPESAWRLLDAVAGDWPAAAAAILLAVAAACLVRLWWQVAFLALWAGVAFTGLVGVYYANTAPLDWLLDTSADRVVFSLVLGVASVAPVLAWLAWEHAYANPKAARDPLQERRYGARVADRASPDLPTPPCVDESS